VDNIDGANLLFNQYLEADLMTAKGRAYGLELFVKKAKGKLTGWISYTLARTERQTPGINNNNWYPSRFDKLHNLNVASVYTLKPRLDVSADFVFMTGTPATFPTSRFEVQGIIIPYNSYGARNNYRIPPYHRLDIAVTLRLKEKEGRKWTGYWVFSVYNVYSHANPFSVYFRQNPDVPNQTQAMQYSIIGRAIPAVSFNFKF
jgi:hypothetical protein